MSDDPQSSKDDDEEGSPIGTLLTGIGCLGMAGFLFYYFTQFEAGEAAGRRMWWALAVLYDIGGKWPPVGLVALIGIVMLALGLKDMMKKEPES
jgi:sulfite exporter TauE/SafE